MGMTILDFTGTYKSQTKSRGRRSRMESNEEVDLRVFVIIGSYNERTERIRNDENNKNVVVFIHFSDHSTLRKESTSIITVIVVVSDDHIEP